jgi:sec-independent protein translocase protein TatC
MTAMTDGRLDGEVPEDPEPSGSADGRPRSRADRETGTMTLFEHLAELRKRLIVSIVAVIAGMVAIWFLYGPIVHFMEHPYRLYFAHHPSKNVFQGQLIVTGPLEGFTTRLKVCGYGGAVLAAPVLIWEIWRFVTPGLYKNEKRYIVPFMAAAIVLFACGVATAILVFPKAIDWLSGASGPGIVPVLSASGYFTLYVAMCVVFGVVFLYPLLLVVLMLVGVVPSATWRKWRRPAIVVLSVVAAVATPSSDPFSFFAMAIPLVLLYELSIIVGRLLKK